MNLIVDKQSNFTELKLSVDKLDDQAAVLLKSRIFEIAASGEKNIILNIVECNECNPSGYSILLSADRICREADGIFIITGINQRAYQLLQVARLDVALNFADSPSMAYDMIKSPELA